MFWRHLVATATAAAAVAAPAAAVAAPAAAPFLARPGLIDRESSAVDLGAIERLDRRLRFLIAAHLHEAEPLGAAAVPVHDHLGRLDRSVRREHLLERGIGDLVGQIANVQFLAHERTPGNRERSWQLHCGATGAPIRAWGRGKVQEMTIHKTQLSVMLRRPAAKS